MKKLTALILALALALSLCAPCFAINIPAYVWHDFTVLRSDVQENGLSLTLYSKDLGVCTAFLDYDVNYEVSVDELDADSTFYATPLAQKGFNAILNHERIAAGTVISLYHSGVAESYPAQIEDITEVYFPCRETDITVDEAEELLDELNELSDGKFSIDDSERQNFPIRTNYTVLSSKNVDGNYSFLFSNYTVNFSEAENKDQKYFTTFITNAKYLDISDDGSERGKAAHEAFNNGEPVPAGTVCELTMSPMIADSYPPQATVYSVRFTGLDTDLTLDEALSEMSGINEMGWDFPVPETFGSSDSTQPDEPAASDELPDVNPKTGVVFPGIATAGLALYAAALFSRRKEI